MIGEWINYFWLLFFRFLYAPQRAIEGNHVKFSIAIIVAYFTWDRLKILIRKSSETTAEFQEISNNSLEDSENTEKLTKMSNMQVSIPQSGAVSTGNREEESEATEETTLTEVRKDLGDAKMHQKTATFEGQETTSIKEDHKSQQIDSSKSVMQQETSTISANKQVFSSKTETSESFSMEETEEFEVEG